MFKILKLFSIAATAFIVSGQALFAGNVPESDDPIKVTIQDWTGQHFSTHVAAGLLKEMGYNVEIVVSDAITQHPPSRPAISIFPLKFGQIMLATCMMAW